MNLEHILTEWWRIVRGQRLLWYLALIGAVVSGVAEGFAGLTAGLLPYEAISALVSLISTLLSLFSALVSLVLVTAALQIARRAYGRDDVTVTWADIRKNLARLSLRNLGTGVLWALVVAFLIFVFFAVGFFLLIAFGLFASSTVENAAANVEDVVGAFALFGFLTGLCLFFPLLLLALPFMQSTQMAAVLEEERPWAEALREGARLARRKFGSWLAILLVVVLGSLLLNLFLVFPMAFVKNLLLTRSDSVLGRLIAMPLGFYQGMMNFALTLGVFLFWGVTYLHFKESQDALVRAQTDEAAALPQDPSATHGEDEPNPAPSPEG